MLERDLPADTEAAPMARDTVRHTALRHARTVNETGRGLFTVTSLAQNWGTRHHEDGKTVWAELPAGPVGAK
ncbi:hypothetical protein ABT133_09155 [Streptomyces sp. NPDC001835]|uniref:hypothetical protein n=1 Tax=Streptomyces sp. NPDC001835 TaxID=3154528 RepID=UPI00332E869C